MAERPTRRGSENGASRACGSSECASWDQAYVFYSGSIHGWLRARVIDIQAVEDLVATVFMRGIETYPSAHNVENMRAFLFHIARNLLVDYYRTTAHARARTVSLDINNSRAEQSLFGYVDRRMDPVHIDDSRRLRSAKSALTPEYRRLLYLRFREGFSHAEVARRTGKTENGVKVTTHRTLKNLRKAMDPNYVFPETDSMKRRAKRKK